MPVTSADRADQEAPIEPRDAASDPVGRSGRTLVLLRHAWAGTREAFEGDDRDRPLDERGRTQAERLPTRLRAVLGDGLDRAVLVASPYARCVETLAPLARSLGTTIELDGRLAEVAVPLHSRDAWPDAAWFGARAAAAIAETGAANTEAADTGAADTDGAHTKGAPELLRPVIVCSHGEVLPAVLAVLAGRDGFEVPAALDLTAKALDKGGAWLLAGDPIEILELPAP